MNSLLSKNHFFLFTVPDETLRYNHKYHHIYKSNTWFLGLTPSERSRKTRVWFPLRHNWEELCYLPEAAVMNASLSTGKCSHIHAFMIFYHTSPLSSALPSLLAMVLQYITKSWWDNTRIDWRSLLMLITELFWDYMTYCMYIQSALVSIVSL